MSFQDYLFFVRKEMYTELQVSVRSSELVEVDQPEVPEGSTTTTTTPPPTAEKEPVLPAIMPENWVFTCFLVFALFGPIVRPEMRYYQSHLFMVRPKDGGDEKKVEIKTSAKTKKKRQKVEVKMEPGVYNRPSPTKNSKLLYCQSGAPDGCDRAIQGADGEPCKERAQQSHRRDAY